jgi:hypothetical protein
VTKGTEYTPTHSEARALAAGKIGLPHAILDRGDIAQMQEIVRDLGDAVTTDKQRGLVAELDGFMAYVRLQICK